MDDVGFIQIKEYADSLRDSGVHGALLVLDPSFGADELAQALGIHSSKNIIRRHLTSELLSVLVPARYILGQYKIIRAGGWCTLATDTNGIGIRVRARSTRVPVNTTKLIIVIGSVRITMF